MQSLQQSQEGRQPLHLPQGTQAITQRALRPYPTDLTPLSSHQRGAGNAPTLLNMSRLLQKSFYLCPGFL
jgi:hypothetical protein